MSHPKTVQDKIDVINRDALDNETLNVGGQQSPAMTRLLENGLPQKIISSPDLDDNRVIDRQFFEDGRASFFGDQDREDERLDDVLETSQTDKSAEVQAEGRLQTLFEFDPNTGYMSWTDKRVAAHLMGTPKADPAICHKSYTTMICDKELETRQQAFAGEQTSYFCQYQLMREDKTLHWVDERGGWIGSGSARRLIGVVRSLESQKTRERELSRLARSDELTGLLNRTSMRSYLDQWFSDAKLVPKIGVYFLVGVDNLGAINADFGFEAADQVITEIALRLETLFGDRAYISRVAGTKFGILIKECNHECVRNYSKQILNCVREDVIDTSKGVIAASVSMGSVMLPEFAVNSQTTMSRAEAALDEAKRLGPASYCVFSETTDNVSMRRRNSRMSDVILTALNEHRIQLAFQEIVSDLETPPSKYECLIRMRGEQGELIPAPDFILPAERLGLVHLLDRRVLELAINTLAVCPNIHLNVNVSMETVKDFVWAEAYISHLRANKNLANRITVELTETQVIDAIDSSIEFVSEIKKLGCEFAIDDFGAGYTSFRNLKALDIDVLKIDGSFVTGLASSRENQLFVRTLLDLARNFEMKTVAEWVDNEADAMLLKGLGVDFLQGFLIGKPEIFPDWLPEGAPSKSNKPRK